jgi:DNA-binding HxlR family transcriptional regulator
MAPTLCARFHKAIELIGGRWTGPILQLLLSGPLHFAELRDSIPNISDRMLSERLRELEQEGLVARCVRPAPPIRVEYGLTEKGRELQASLVAVGKWAERWIALPPAPPAAAPSARRPVRSRAPKVANRVRRSRASNVKM